MSSAKPINAIAAECGITGVDEAALSRFAAAVLAAGYPSLGDLRIASVHKPDGERIGLQLSIGFSFCCVYDDQKLMPGFRDGQLQHRFAEKLTTRVLR